MGVKLLNLKLLTRSGYAESLRLKDVMELRQ
jgi:hypothetical protein